MPAHDVLIIGAGLAGQRAAIAAAGAGSSVAIMSKVHPVRSHSNAAAGGINAALNPDDSWESHAFDTVKGSDYLGDQDAIEIMCREAPGEDGQVRADTPLEVLLASEPLRRFGALMAVDGDGRLRGVVTLDQVSRALQAQAGGA